MARSSAFATARTATVGTSCARAGKSRPEEPYRIAGVLGVVLIKGGNHKLAVELEQPHAPLSKERVAEDVRTFVRVYGETHPGTSKARVRYLALDEFELDF